MGLRTPRSKPKKTKTLIVDGNVLMKRSYNGAKNVYHKDKHIGGIFAFYSTLRKLILEHKIEKVVITWDGERGGTLRLDYYPDYKGNRPNEKNIAPFFKIAYEENLFEKAGIKTILKYPKLEADDCIALTTKFIINKYPDINIYIIASDMDYLQIAKDNTKIYDLKFKDITKSKRCFKNPEKDLFCKIVAGDKSDNIPSIFPKCGIKTAEKYFNNKELFNKKLAEDPEAQILYERNKNIIDFECIPKELVDGFNNTVLMI